MKYPTNTKAIIEARMYAIESISHTYDYDGWNDGYEKSARIITGKFCQLWLVEYCRLNGIPHVKDTSSPYIHDNGDLLINGWNIDCKASINANFKCQISPHFDKDVSIDYYAFFMTDKRYSYIEPLGFIQKSEVINCSSKIMNGEKIPNTNIIQKFGEYSYFVDIDKVTPFDVGIRFLSRKKKLT